MLKQSKLLASLGLKDAAVALVANGDDNIAEAIKIAYPQVAEKIVKKTDEELAQARIDQCWADEGKRIQAKQEHNDRLASDLISQGITPPEELLAPVEPEVTCE